MYLEGIAELQKAKDEAGGPLFAIAALGNAYGVSGHRAEALASLQELKRIAATKYVPSPYFAGVCIGLGDKDQAFNWLNKAVREHSEYLIYLNVEPMGDPLRSDPRFRDVIQRIGLLP